MESKKAKVKLAGRNGPFHAEAGNSAGSLVVQGVAGDFEFCGDGRSTAFWPDFGLHGQPPVEQFGRVFQCFLTLAFGLAAIVARMNPTAMFVFESKLGRRIVHKVAIAKGMRSRQQCLSESKDGEKIPKIVKFRIKIRINPIFHD
ncbi:hypothetical protein [Paraburkholderia sp. J67]|uniref:hypothetical protein n=1 Tax=Paraburkholderia sp. J67 TaxID=2805435 RepID=UPI002ABDB4E6|nr:hypothetical protein [Paraburkholderia sp. J67]